MEAQSVLRSRAFGGVLAFALLIYLPMGIFFYLQWPDWSWLYYVDPRSVSMAVTGLVWLAYPIAVLFGFGLAASIVRGDSPRLVLIVPVLGFVLLGGVTVSGWHRFLHASNYEEYNLWLTRPVGDLPWIWTQEPWLAAMAGAGLFVGIPFAYLFLGNLRAGGAGLLPPVKP